MADDERRIDQAIALARQLVEEAARLEARQPRRERRHRARMRALVRDAAAADFTVRLTDEVPRIPVPATAARRFSKLVESADLGGFAWLDRMMLNAGARLAPVLPRVVMPLVVRRLRAEAASVILPADDPAFGEHLARRRAEGVRCNVNILGEAIVGNEEARRRLAQVLDRLERPDVDYVSVKISAISAGVSALGFDATVARVCDALRALYVVAASFDPPKFVNLDMEEYRDLDLTIAAFQRVLDEPELEHLDAGVVLQAYLPDTRGVARSLGEWANRRRARGGGRIKVRVVKGANLAMEHVEAEMHGWQLAPYDSKHEVDANYKAVLDVLLDPAFDQSVRIGLASHNLFDVAWGFGLREELREAGRPARIEIEMLEGMAPAQAATVRRLAGDLLLYTPVVERRDFPSAIAYLVRRLDENTSPENFLAHLFDLAADPATFDDQAARFAASVRARHTVNATRRRTASRVAPTATAPLSEPFSNAPDTDWTHPENRRWITGVLAEPRADFRETFVAPTTDDVDAAVNLASAAGAHWGAVTAIERRRDHQPSRRRLRSTSRPTPRHDGRRREQVDCRGRPRSVRGGRPRSLLRAGRARSRRHHGCQTVTARSGRRLAALELPARHPGRRCPRRARGWELGDPQARASESCDRRAHRRAVLGRRASTAMSSSSSRPTTTKPGAGSSPTPTSPR